MRIFDYIDTIEKPTIDNIRVIYKAINVKYDELIDMAVEPNSKNYNKWMQTLDCLKASEDLIIECIGKNAITDMEWLQLKCNIYKFQVKYGGLKYLNVEAQILGYVQCISFFLKQIKNLEFPGFSLTYLVRFF